MLVDCREKYCVVGAGSSGLTAAKNLKECGIPFDVLEKESALGGLWNYENPNSSVYRSTHLISSKPLTEFTDYPLPADYPDYPNHRQVLAYFEDYARHFGLLNAICFGCKVEHICRQESRWRVVLDSGEERLYGGLIIANGHLWDAKFPVYPGEFTGEVLHSKQYKTPDVLRDKRVLVVGAGNSGCDIAVEAAQNARQTFHSVRRGYYYIPKYFFGRPADQVGELSLKLRVPLPVRRALNTFLLKLTYGDPQQFGLPKPDHKLFESHPIVNSQLFYYLGHGDILPKPDVEELCGDRVRFKDGSSEQIDLIIYATGYHISFPFIERDLLNWHNGCPHLFMHVFHPTFDNLFVAGLIQPDSGQWGLVDYQMQVAAKFIQAQKSGSAKAQVFRKIKATPGMFLKNKIRYVQSSRHFLEVEHFSYRQGLKKLLKLFD